METVKVSGQKREANGKSAVNKVRKDGRIPAVVYGGNDEISFSVAYKEVKPLIYTADFKLAEVNVDDENIKCIVKDIQFHPVTEEILHVDFLRLVDNQPIKVEVPIILEGVAPGVAEGGILMEQMRKIQIKALPKNLVDEMVVDVTDLHLGFSVKVKDIREIDGIEIMHNPGVPVASVDVPRALKSEEAEEEEGEGEFGEEGEGEGEGGEAGSEENSGGDE